MAGSELVRESLDYLDSLILERILRIHIQRAVKCKGSREEEEVGGTWPSSIDLTRAELMSVDHEDKEGRGDGKGGEGQQGKGGKGHTP